MSESSHTQPIQCPPPPPRYLRLTRQHLLGAAGDVIEIRRIVQDSAGYRYVLSGRSGVAPLRELLDAADVLEEP